MKVYGQVSALDEENREENNLYGHSQPVSSKQSMVVSDDLSDDYAEPLSVGISPAQPLQIYQSINIPPVVSHSSLSSPSSPSCSSQCGCSSRLLDPVCGADGLMYLSPCHAGCTQSPGESLYILGISLKYHNKKPI